VPALKIGQAMCARGRLLDARMMSRNQRIGKENGILEIAPKVRELCDFEPLMGAAGAEDCHARHAWEDITLGPKRNAPVSTRAISVNRREIARRVVPNEGEGGVTPPPDRLQPRDREDARNATLPVEGAASSGPAAAAQSYFLIFEANSSRVFPLPFSGEVVAGRAESADLRLDDGGVSRHHARIVLNGAHAHVVDLQSHNGTILNGERIVGAMPLGSGDTLVLSKTTLVFHGGSRRPAVRTLVDFARLRQRAEDEIERGQRSRRPFALAALLLGTHPDERARAATVLSAELRRIDLAAWDGSDRLLVLLAETDAEHAQVAAARLVRALATVAPATQAGFASWPMDGVDFDTLLSSARSAARAATSHRPTHAAENFTTIRVGDREAIVADPAMRRVYALVEELAAANMPVLITGETGSGKDLVAAALHARSARREHPLISINCASLPESLIESELFGFERGAFTGAVASKPGLITAAHKSTLFMDEIAELPPSAQAKLLRVVDTKHLRMLGDVEERALDVRIIAATNKDLAVEVEAGRFRRDLYFRLKGATVWIPPLRDRRGEIPILVNAFLRGACSRLGRQTLAVSPAAMEELVFHEWQGNVRELRNLLEFVAAVVKGPVLEPWHFAEWLGGPAVIVPPAGDAAAQAPSFRNLSDEIRELEKCRIIEALAAANGNRTQAAALIGMPLRTFVARLRTHELQENSPPRKPPRP
jgi:DNA-binding NtrC family response regulator